ncbi:MAG: hypothetical protein H6544_04570 [Prevotellaceae bacterium]|nr:hypothetical protein [Prevotellaceae bacterium]
MKITTTLWKRGVLSFLALLAGVAMLEAQTISADETSACENDPVVLKAEGFASSVKAIDWLRSTDGTNWTTVRSTSGNVGTFVDDMPGMAVRYKAKDQNSATITNTVTVTLSTNCAAICHTTSTGDYFSGTDFDPESGVTTPTPAIPSEVVNYFEENDITLISQNSTYEVTTDLSSQFGSYVPSLDEGGNSNYYYMYTNPPSSSQPFEYRFKCSTYVGKHYRYTMRFYLLKKSDNCGGSAKIKLETGHGNQTTDRATLDIYDDAADVKMKSLDITETFGSTDLNIGGSDYANKLLRVEITYYGYFPDDKYDPNSGTYNGLQYFTLKPLFQQFDGCFALAIDYISAEIESVCMNRGAVCVGESAVVNAAGFPKNAKYTWEVENGGVWEPVVIGGITMDRTDLQSVNIPVTTVGKKIYRVRDANSTVSIEFTVTGKDCDPVQPTDILGPESSCAPVNNLKFSVSPVDANSLVRYSWEMITPSGNVLTNNVSFTGGSLNPAGRGDTIYVTLNGQAEEGEYTLKVQPIIKRNGVDELVGAPITRTFRLHQTPSVSLKLSGYADGVSEGDKKLCPSDKNQRIVAVADVMPPSYSDYIYTWEHATAIANTDSAVVNLPTASSCDGSMKSLAIGVTVSIKDIGCPATKSNTYTLEDVVAPTVDCGSLTSAQLNYVLGATQKEVTVDLPIPNFGAGCDSNPSLDIDVLFSGKDGTSFVKNFHIEKKNLATADKKVTLPAGTAAVTYTVTDGCGKTASCTATITVVDNTAPKIDCDKIKSYTAHLSKQEACVAVPGYAPTELPMLTAPVLTDMNGVDGNITGIYMGRRENCVSEPAASPSLFTESIGLNASYKLGTSYILWAFTDKSGNTSYCLSSVSVIDDKEPTLNCPADADLGDIAANVGTCSLSLDSLLVKMPQGQKPSATDNCSSSSSITAKMYYRKVGDATWIEIVDPTALLFDKGVQYELDWRFYKKTTSASVDKTVYVDCPQTFKVVDKEAPDFDCESLQDIRVMANSYRLWHRDNGGYWSTEYDDFASGSGSSSESDYVFSLKPYFDDKTLQMHGDVTDNCGGGVKVKIEIDNVDGEKTVIASLSAFQKYEFQIGASTVYYTFSDDADPANSKTCEQTVVVSSQDAPIPDCGALHDTVLYANADCEATMPIALSQIPTATIKYNKEVKYVNDETSGCNAIYDYDRLSYRKSLTGERTMLGYPYAVKLIREDGTSDLCENIYTDADTVQSKLVQHRKYWPIETICKTDVVSTLKIKRTNFASVPTCATAPFHLGTNKLVWYFENADGLNDSCTTVIVVKDTTAPSVICGDWEKNGTFYADEECKVPASEVALKKPTATDLHATDNCTVSSDFDISWNRTFNGTTTTDLSAPFEVGMTTIKWIVKDESGNASFCYQEIEVLDTIGPKFDCSTLVDLKVSADGDCEAKSSAVIAAGLVTPETAADDACSPTGATIKGVGERSDGKDIFTDPYPKGTTTITWTFTDGVGNKTVCKQNVIVTDDTDPLFVDCDAMTDVVVKLNPEECSASLDKVKASLGSHTAEDNCTGTIDGVPMLLLPDGSLTALPSAFKKDTTFVIVWVFEDESGNKTECSQKLVIKDVTPPDPSGSCPDPTKTVTATVECSVSYSDLGLSPITIDDPCDGPLVSEMVGKIKQHDGSVITYRGEAELNAATYPVGTHTFYWIFTDKAGLKDTCEMRLTVTDGILPVVEDCDVAKDITVTVSDDECAIHPEDLKGLIVHPKAYDECDDEAAGIGKVFLDPIIERWFDGYRLDDAEGKPIDWDSQDFPKGTTTIKWIFKDKAGNEVTCEKRVTVEDHTAPYFDCSTLDPDTLRPVALAGRCDVQFNEITFNDYYAEDKCTTDSIKGVLTLNGSTFLPTDYTMEVGKIYTLQWVFVDEDGNKKTCPQWIVPSHSMPINFDCSTLQTVEKLATEGECTISSTDLALPVPETRDTCTKEQIVATGSRSDGLAMTADYPTGTTIVTWTFVSPYNLDSVKTCDQTVSVLGNKKFDIDCETLISVARDTISGCGTSDIGADIEAPVVDDPCANPDSSYFKRVGVGTRSDALALTDPYPLGVTTIKWIFTDFTGSVKDSCNQDVVVKTDLEVDFDCDSLTKDTIKVAVKPGECTVSSDKLNLHFPKAANPCTGDSIEGVPSRQGGLSMSDPYHTGMTKITWTFTDTTGILAKPVSTCFQWVQVGDVNKVPVDCDNMPDTLIKLPENDCEILFKELNFNIPPVYDLCTGVHIDSVVTRTSGAALDDPFKVGRDTIYWDYSFEGQDFRCTQIIAVKDSMAPEFDCSTLDTIRLASVPGKCYTDLDSVLAEFPNPLPTATEVCTGQKIEGKYAQADGSPLPSKIAVGDTLFVYWTFMDTAINLVPKICEQPVIVIGDLEPEVNCDEIMPINIYIESGCDTTLKPIDIVTPFALDACTKDTVYGVATRSDGNELFSKYPVGATTITWKFISPYSTAVASCEQEVHVYTESQLIFDCETYSNDTVKVKVPEGECFVDVTLETPFALNPCPDNTDQDTIWGEPKRNDNKLISDPFPTGITKVEWTFTDHSGTLRDSIIMCTKVVQVGDVNEIPVKCENIPDTVFVLEPNDCDINWSEMNFNVPDVKDLCTGALVTPTFDRTSGIDMSLPFKVGVDTVKWHYDFSGQTYTCSQVIKVKDSMEPEFDCSTLDTIRMKSLAGECYTTLDSLKLALGNPEALDKCSDKKIPGVPTMMDGSALPSQIAVGDTLIVKWTFFDDTINTVAKVCEQAVLVIGDGEPKFECSSLKDTVLYLQLVDECELPAGRLTLNVPVAKDSCTDADVPGVATRLDGANLTDVYPKGTTEVSWTFISPYSTATRTCSQNVIVKDTFPPVLSCETLKDTIKVRITTSSASDNSVTSAEAEAAGLVAPSVTDPCDGNITAVGSRDDGKTMQDVYPLGSTNIVWTYTDKSGNSDTCRQVVLVEDWILDTLYCPQDLEGKTFSCVTGVPDPYATFEEFKLAGGSFSNEGKIKEGSFTYTDKMDGDSCLMTFIRTYKVTDVRNNEIACSQTVSVKDDVAPVFDQELSDIKISCTDEIPAVPVVTVTDNCDPNPTLSYYTTDDRSDNPSDCSYYTYDIRHIWKAIDRCGNEETKIQVVHVVDDQNPVIDFPKDWKDTVLSIYRKGCVFEVPDFTDTVRTFVSDNCTDISNIKVWQHPSAGDTLLSSVRVWVYISDMCGNMDSLSRYVLVPAAGSVVSLVAHDTTLCGSDASVINLWSQQIRYAEGTITVKDWDESLIDIASSFVYDCYRDTLAESNLVYSDNPNTYYSKFYGSNKVERDSIRNSRIKIKKMLQSGRYYFVAMDTMTLCSDTASAYLTIHERPRISMRSELQKICELNGVDTDELHEYVNCVNNMGAEITDQGWLLGDSIYNSNDTIYYEDDKKSFVYFAENECGRSTSLDTYKDFCNNPPRTYKDSLAAVGGSADLYNLLKTDDLKTRDSLFAEVHRRYSPDSLFLLPTPNDPARIWLGDEVTLTVVTNYVYDEVSWFEVMGNYDRRFTTGFEHDEFVFSDPSDQEDDKLYSSEYGDMNYITQTPRDTVRYYVTITDKVCPSVASNVVSVDVLSKVPTAITPYDRDGLNDVFMKGHSVMVFNRYGQKLFEGVDGWDGTYRGQLVDPGVYFHQVVMRDGTVIKGTIEVVKVK